jgi:hypothetical protein
MRRLEVCACPRDREQIANGLFARREARSWWRRVQRALTRVLALAARSLRRGHFQHRGVADKILEVYEEACRDPNAYVASLEMQTMLLARSSETVSRSASCNPAATAALKKQRMSVFAGRKSVMPSGRKSLFVPHAVASAVATPTENGHEKGASTSLTPCMPRTPRTPRQNGSIPMEHAAEHSQPSSQQHDQMLGRLMGEQLKTSRDLEQITQQLRALTEGQAVLAQSLGLSHQRGPSESTAFSA